MNSAKQIIDQWNKKGQNYLLVELDNKAVEIDTDGEVYLHVDFNCMPVQYTVLKKSLCEYGYIEDYHNSHETSFNDGHLIISYSPIIKHMSVVINNGSIETFDLFLKSELTIINIGSFLNNAL